MTTARILTGAAAASELVKLAGQGAYERGVASRSANTAPENAINDSVAKIDLMSINNSL